MVALGESSDKQEGEEEIEKDGPRLDGKGEEEGEEEEEEEEEEDG